MNHRGMILIVVLVVVAALSLGALAFSALMVSEREVVYATGRGIQARALAESGIERMRIFLSGNPDICYGDGAWYDDAATFRGVLVVDGTSPRERGRFSIVAPASAEGLGGVRFGLTCESAKLNLNTLLVNDTSSATTPTNTPTSSSGSTSASNSRSSADAGSAATGDSTSSSGTTARQRLMALPNMTEEIADAILDWLDGDGDVREYGAEGEFYESLSPSYRPGNGAFRCLDELLAVRGVTPELLYGADRNRNGAIDADESLPADTEGNAAADAFGWSAYLTLYSREKNMNAEGEDKIDLNQGDAQTLFDELKEAFDEEWATFIVAYRQQEQLYSENANSGSNTNSNASGNQNNDSQNGQDRRSDSNGTRNSSEGRNTNGGQNTGGDQNAERGRDSRGGSNGDQNGDGKEEEVQQQEHASGQLDLSKPLKQTLTSVLDLIGSKVKVTYAGSDKATVISPLFANEQAAMREYLPRLVALADVGTAAQDGRINVNLAPVEVLAGVPGIGEELAEEIVSRRPTDPLTLEIYQRHPTWLIIDGLATLDKMKTLLPYLTAGGSVYSVQSVGFYDKDGPVVRLEAVLDSTESPPKVLFIKELSPLGRGFEPLDLGAEE